ncbi:unnamed protein product [Oikopleura dioica]|uniref:Uncharacterized protein n=1 Tax=Oikopleura dioica TaxID=34765 RepID=E4YKT1_OIKDI|nr:unnamed protein product [Oikopleura dioica]
MHRNDFTTIQKDGTIFLFGGYSDLVQEYTHRIWKYLPESHSWTIEGNMLVNRMNFASALVNGNVFSVGGFYELNHESYDFETGLSTALDTTLESKLFVELVPFSFLGC